MTGFSDIKNSGNIYVDKTDLINEFAQLRGPIFLSRPRRFGKSLLIDTLHSLFAKGIEDFHELALEKLWKDITYKVIRIDFSGMAESSPENLKISMTDDLIEQFDVKETVSPLNAEGKYFYPSDILKKIARKLQDNSTVLLIDEYDAPLTHHINNSNDLQQIIQILNNFYAVVKEFGKKFRFIFITGVTRTAHISIFSAYNNLRDISIENKFNTLLGFTQDEIERYFDGYINNAAVILNMSKNAISAWLKHFYDGFQFAIDAKETLYNPWSVLSFLQNPENGFKNYWYHSGGVSSLVVNCLKIKDNFDFIKYEDREIVVDREQLLDRYEISNIPQEILLWQAGYFTLHTRRNKSLRLIPPNGEVEASLLRIYLTANNLKPVKYTRELIEDLITPIDSKDISVIVETFNAILNVCVSSNSVIFQDERSVRDLIFAALYVFAPLHIFKERESVKGFSDLELVTDQTHMVIEFKRTYPKGENKSESRDAKASLAEAIKQIESHRYGEAPFSVQTLFRVAMVISTEEKRILPEYCREV